LARQGAAEQRPTVLAQARAVRESELLAMRQSDVVITHSDAEAAYLRRQAPGIRVGVVGWPVPSAPAAPAVSRRTGIAFIGSYAHAPNQDAVRWLMDEIMPRVWRRDPRLVCSVVGHGWPKEMFAKADRRIVLQGPVDDLTGWLQAKRLTVAPLRFGAGVKGKVLDSLAAGIPCAMTTIAAEGIALHGTAQSCIADTADTLAETILNLYADPILNHNSAQAGRRMVREDWTLERVTQDLAAALSIAGDRSDEEGGDRTATKPAADRKILSM
jgi:glycosyltransferase involved in cell wall biosynthesis